MATTIKLYYVDRNDTYKEWELIPSKLLVVEDIASYLATKSALTLNNMQYQKNKLEMGINIDLSQTYSQPKATTSFKYVSIQNEGELIHYYFIKEVEWRSKSCVRFELVMDVLNTFEENKDYNFKANTRIIREHKDRFVPNGIILSLGLGQIQSEVGTLAEEDNVQISYYDTDLQEWKALINGVIENIDLDEEVISFYFANSTITTINHLFYNKVEYGYEFLVKKDNSNYLDFLADSNVYDINAKLYRKIDYVSEGINPVLIRDSQERKIEKTGILKQNWYLLYRNQNDPSESLTNPVQCYLIPEEATKTDAGYVVGGRLTPSFLLQDKYYYFEGAGHTFTLSNGQSISGDAVCIFKCGNKITIETIKVNGIGDYEVYRLYDDIDYVDISNVPVMYGINDSFITLQSGTSEFYTFYTTHLTNTFNNTGERNYLSAITEVDRTDAKNIKLIKLPYCPYNFSYSSDILLVDSDENWVYETFEQYNGVDLKALKLLNLHTKLQANISAGSYNPFNNLYFGLAIPNIDTSRRGINVKMESKLFHSDFYSPTFVYDSFALQVQLEKCELSSYIDNFSTNTIKFTCTSTINSKFLFSFTSYVCDKAEQNFYNVIPVARNNEEVLYNVPYINYVRTGYNYDIKAKNLQNVGNAVGLGLSAGSFAVAMAMPSAPLKVAGIVAGLVSMAMSVKSTITSAINSANSIQQKQEQYKNQATSVAGSDDVDLMSEYCENRLRYYEYTPTDTMLNLLNDLFFYAGYSSNRMGIPNHNTRVNFDYLECEASIECISSIPQDCLEELISCFKNGITYLHKTTRASKKWDFAQEYENWELILLED